MKHESEPRAIAAIDIGSNSIKMSIGRLDSAGKLVETPLASRTVRLGAGLEQTGALAPDRIDDAVATLRDFARVAHDAGASEITAVATEATRAASNGAEFLERAKRESGLDIEIISGDREARLTFLGLTTVVNLTGVHVLADIGGGSTELILVRDNEMDWARSIRLGSGRLADRFLENDPPTAKEIDACVDAAAEILAREPELPDNAIKGEGQLILTGGTGEFLDRVESPGDQKPAHWLASVRRVLEQRTVAELAKSIQAAEARARVLPAGAAIVSALIDRFDPAQLTVARAGIRSGLLLEALTPDKTKST